MKREEATHDWLVETTDGEFIGYIVEDLRFDSKVNPENLREHLHIGQAGYKECTWPTVTDMKSAGKAVEKFAYDEYDIDFDEGVRSLTKEDVEKVIAEFREHGFNVTKEAIEHNYIAWRSDFKSGYRDAVNGYHLFTPCGCNPLSFRASTLVESAREWQQTYE